MVYYTKLFSGYFRIIILEDFGYIFERNIDDRRFEISTRDERHDGNLFFMHKHRTIDIARQIKSMNTFKEFDDFYTDELIEGNVLLQEYLSELLTRYEMKAEIVSIKIGYSHGYVRKIAMGDRLNPRRDVLLAICTYIHATVEETQLLLRYAGQQPLYARRKRDAIIWFALEKGQNLLKEENASEREKKRERDFDELNDFLLSKKYDPLWKK